MRQAFAFHEVQGVEVVYHWQTPISIRQPIRNLISHVLSDYANIEYNATKGQYF